MSTPPQRVTGTSGALTETATRVKEIDLLVSLSPERIEIHYITSKTPKSKMII